MTAVACCQALQDSPQIIERTAVGLGTVAVPLEFTILLPSNLITDSNKGRPVFQCRMATLDHHGGSLTKYVDWSGTINGVPFFTAKHPRGRENVGVPVPFWEIAQWEPILDSGATLGSSVTLVITSTTVVRLSDIIVWYQVEV